MILVVPPAGFYKRHRSELRYRNTGNVVWIARRPTPAMLDTLSPRTFELGFDQLPKGTRLVRPYAKAA